MPQNVYFVLSDTKLLGYINVISYELLVISYLNG